MVVVDMDMPKFCQQCGGCTDIDGKSYFCSLSENAMDINDIWARPKECPIKGHLKDYIDKIKIVK